jgi:hypothetical protein
MRQTGPRIDSRSIGPKQERAAGIRLDTSVRWRIRDTLRRRPCPTRRTTRPSPDCPRASRDASPRTRPAGLRLGELPDRSDLDTPQTRRRDSRGHLDGLVQIPGLDEREPAQLLLRFGERPVGRGDLAAAGPARSWPSGRIAGRVAVRLYTASWWRKARFSRASWRWPPQRNGRSRNTWSKRVIIELRFSPDQT